MVVHYWCFAVSLRVNTEVMLYALKHADISFILNITLGLWISKKEWANANVTNNYQT